MRNLQRATILAATSLSLAGVAAAQSPTPTPFTIIGYIESITLDDPADPLSGGTVTANGLTVAIPRNTIVRMPAAGLSMGDLFAMAPLPYGPSGNGQSGLAHADSPPPLASYEVEILGNQVGGVYVAGLVKISQELFNLAQGAINCIDYTTGELRVGGAAGDCASGTRVRLADPAGRHGRPASHDPRFTSDPENPNIRSITGYPMCLPRTDPAVAADALCPQTNRPKDFFGGFQSRWRMGLEAGTDAAQQAPFEVGDQVTFSGTLAPDGAGGAYVEAWSVVANLGIETRPGVDPAYVAVDELIFGTGGTPVPGIPLDAQDAVLFMAVVGFTTDPTRLVDAYAVDVNVATGAETERLIATMNPAVAPPAVLDSFATEALTAAYMPLFREVRVRIRGAPRDQVVANGQLAATYRAPVDEYEFPLNLRPGDPLVPMNFQALPFLACRGSDYVPSSGGPALAVGQLAPFPNSPTPDPAGCVPPPPQNPIANAGADFSVASGAVGSLDASASFDPNGGTLTFNWTQTSGPPRLLSNPNLASPTFDAPVLQAGDAPVTLEFRLLVTNANASAVSSVTVTVTPPAAGEPPADPGTPPGGGGGTGGGGCGTAGHGGAAPGILLALAALLMGSRPST